MNKKSCYHLTHCNIVQFKGLADVVSSFQFWSGVELFEAAVYLQKFWLVKYDHSDMETGLFLPWLFL